MDLPSTSSLFNTFPPSPKTLYQKRKSDIYAPITPRRRSSLTTRYNFAMTHRLLSEACNICLGDYEEGEDICWYEFKSFHYNFCRIYCLSLILLAPPLAFPKVLQQGVYPCFP